MTHDEVDGLVAMLQRILDAEAVLGAVLHGGEYVEENRTEGMDVLDRAVRYAREHGHQETADHLQALHAVFPANHEQGCVQLREVRISARLRLDAATAGAGLPRIAPASLRIGVPERRSTPKTGRNQPCPCGSGKKYKRCHGRPRLLH